MVTWPANAVAVVDLTLQTADGTDEDQIEAPAPLQPKDHTSFFLQPAWAACFGLTPVPLHVVDARNTVVEHGKRVGHTGLVMSDQTNGPLCYDEFLRRLDCECNPRHLTPAWVYWSGAIECAEAKKAGMETYVWCFMPCGLMMCCLWCHRRAGSVDRCPLVGKHMPVDSPIPTVWTANLEAAMAVKRNLPKGSKYKPKLCYGQASAGEACGDWVTASPIESE